MITLYNVISADGFIARKDGSEDFIPDEVWNDFLDLCHEYEAVVMGSRTHEALQKYDPLLLKAFESIFIKKIVVSRDENFSPKEGYIKMSSPQEVASLGLYTLLTSGPSLNTVFLEEKLIDKVILNKLPNAIGEGLKQFEKGFDPILMPDLNVDKNGTLNFYTVS
jgi:dihydrofolate reductase